MIIVQISDTHITESGEASDARKANLEACISHINGLAKQPDIVVHSGDLSHDNLDAEYQTLIAAMKKLKAPHYVIPGNRDSSDKMRMKFDGQYPLTTKSSHFCYVIDDYPVRLIALDTTSDKSGLGQFCEARSEFLKDALATEGDKPTMIAMHHPPYAVSVSRDPMQFEDPGEMQRFQDVVSAHPGKIRIICGHVHRNSFGNIGEVASSSMPSVALDLRRKNDPLVVDNEVMYHIHEFGPDGNCATRLVRVPMQEREVVIKHPVPGGMAV